MCWPVHGCTTSAGAPHELHGQVLDEKKTKSLKSECTPCQYPDLSACMCEGEGTHAAGHDWMHTAHQLFASQCMPLGFLATGNDMETLIARLYANDELFEALARTDFIV